MTALQSIGIGGVVCLLFTTGASGESWISDRGDGDYQNPVLFADYSDPDVVRVGDDFYMTASSFNCLPGLPILHSRDLVNWTIVGHAVQRLPSRFDRVQHGNGIWAPSIRHHAGYYWIFVGDPDRGILMTRAKDPSGPWEPLHELKPGKGLIDPCPLWDDDGKAYLVHAFAKSRAGKNAMLVAQEMSADGKRILGEEHLVVDGRNDVHPTVEGPKFYKRNGWYYLFAPAGGVETGWQMVFRSKRVFGPYEAKRVLEQGSTEINGPHQGAWVELPSGESWFVHFQERGAYGRIVHLNPVTWVDDWPVMGKDFDGNAIGEPVATHRKPNVRQSSSVVAPQTTDDFEGEKLGLQWQWQGNWSNDWASLNARPGWLRLKASGGQIESLADAPNLLLQKLPSPAFTATTAVELPAGGADLRAGLVVVGENYAGLMLSRQGGNLKLQQIERSHAWSPGKEQVRGEVDGLTGPVWLRIRVEPEAKCSFSYSTNGQDFTSLGQPFTAIEGKWIGAKIGIVAHGEQSYADFSEFTIE